MCDASNSTLGAVLGHESASSCMSLPMHLGPWTQPRSYLLGSKIIVFSDHAALKFLLKRLNTQSRLNRWILLLQEFDIEIKDKKGVENTIADHLSQLEREVNHLPIRDEFLDEQIL
ncbi:Retrovirus-related Pol polyprotein from transposon 17.6, partial [Mucuna pruriens]